jgi:hypothetical protein
MGRWKRESESLGLPPQALVNSKVIAIFGVGIQQKQLPYYAHISGLDPVIDVATINQCSEWQEGGFLPPQPDLFLTVLMYLTLSRALAPGELIYSAIHFGAQCGSSEPLAIYERIIYDAKFVLRLPWEMPKLSPSTGEVLTFGWLERYVHEHPETRECIREELLRSGQRELLLPLNFVIKQHFVSTRAYKFLMKYYCSISSRLPRMGSGKMITLSRVTRRRSKNYLCLMTIHD